jgi:hypothetical protein
MTGIGATAETKSSFTVSGGTALAQQPLTSPVGLGRFTEVPADVPLLSGKLAVLQGTMGVDRAIAPFERGHVYVIPVDPVMNTRLPSPVDLATTGQDPLLRGLVKSAAVWDIQLEIGERVFGMPRVLNNRVVFSTAFGSFTGDITDTIGESGRTLTRGPTAASNSTIDNHDKAFGGVLLLGDKMIITTSMGIKKADPANGVSEGTAQQRPFNRTTPAVFKTWEPDRLDPAAWLTW